MQNPKHAGLEVRKEEEQGPLYQVRAGVAAQLRVKPGAEVGETGQEQGKVAAAQWGLVE